MKFALLVFLTISVSAFSQEKKRFFGGEEILTNVQPGKSITSWTIHKNEDGTDKIIKKSGEFLSAKSESGFWNDSGTYYYIVYKDKSGIHTITDPKDFRNFVSVPKSGYDAGFISASEGYFADEEYKDIAGNFAEDKTKYDLELGKITSESCPFRKTEFFISIDKATGKIISAKEGKTYMEVYLKNCANNPRNQPTKAKNIYLEDPKKKK